MRICEYKIRNLQGKLLLGLEIEYVIRDNCCWLHRNGAINSHYCVQTNTKQQSFVLPDTHCDQLPTVFNISISDSIKSLFSYF